MTIKKLVVGSMFSMLLGSEMAAADWGDVYYCQMTNMLQITLEGEKKNYKLEKFQFKLDQTKNAMVFGSTGYFQDEVIELVIDENWPRLEFWYAKDQSSITFFKEGKLLYTSNNGSIGIISSSADCDKF
jgi:hypothetical protein